MPVFAWMLNLVYVALLVALSPVLVYRRMVHGKYRDGWREKLLGGLPLRDGGKPCVWFHAVSVGEVVQLEPVLTLFRQQRSDVEIVITTTTSTGRDVACSKFPHDTVCYFPLDFSWAVRRAIRRIRPALIVLVELELWPNFILAAHRNGIPLALINGRLSGNSFRGYSRIRPLVQRLLSCFRVLAVQNTAYRERFLMLEAPAERVHVTGSVKFDGVETDRNNRKTRELRNAFRIHDGECVFIAGSTQAPEEEYALETWLALRGEFPKLRLILVPRHKERFEEVAALVRRRGLPLIRRSRQVQSPESSVPRGSDGGLDSGTGRWTLDAGLKPVLLLDTLGELSACWGLADVAFVGGSLTNRGGQNMIEPASYGAAVLFGPNTWNFQETVDTLLSRKAARVVHGQTELVQTVRTLLLDAETARRQGRAAQEFVLSQQGAGARTVALLQQLMSAPAHEEANSSLRAA